MRSNKTGAGRKRKIKPVASIQRLVVRLEAVLRAGQMCSNACYNLAQKDYTLPDDARSMRDSYAAWDEAEPKIRKLMPPNREVGEAAGQKE